MFRSPLDLQVQQRPGVWCGRHGRLSGAADKDAAADPGSDDHKQPPDRESADPAGGGMYTHRWTFRSLDVSVFFTTWKCVVQAQIRLFISELKYLKSHKKSVIPEHEAEKCPDYEEDSYFFSFSPPFLFTFHSLRPETAVRCLSVAPRRPFVGDSWEAIRRPFIIECSARSAMKCTT